MRQSLAALLFALVVVAGTGRAFAARPLPVGHWDRRLDKGRVLIREHVDSRYRPLTTVVVPDEKMKATVETLFRAVLPHQFGPYEQKNFDGTLNFSVGTAIDTQILTLKEYGDQALGTSLYAHRDLKEARNDLKDHDILVIRYFPPKDLFGPEPPR
ncbi:MAG: hypothetical protein KGL74_03710 [Elusimicrobia bacterium]|nr:hypothetical protein [Elusimicrobiota bacterium]MDE2510207.1 hypothetical protein [Elusimicrobiota bacterium]